MREATNNNNGRKHKQQGPQQKPQTQRTTGKKKKLFILKGNKSILPMYTTDIIIQANGRLHARDTATYDISAIGCSGRVAAKRVPSPY